MYRRYINNIFHCNFELKIFIFISQQFDFGIPSIPNELCSFKAYLFENSRTQMSRRERKNNNNCKLLSLVRLQQP